jgi:hypothetical protein
MCSNMPKLMDGKQFEQCMKGMKGKKMRGHGGAGSSEEQGGGRARGGDDRDGDRPESDVASGDGQLEALTAPRSGKRGGKMSRSKREPHRGTSWPHHTRNLLHLTIYNKV